MKLPTTGLKVPTLEAARALRDSGIEALAALDEGVRLALAHVQPGDEREIKLAVGRAMATVLEEIVNPPMNQFPELEIDDQTTWRAIAKAKAQARAAE